VKSDEMARRVIVGRGWGEDNRSRKMGTRLIEAANVDGMQG